MQSMDLRIGVLSHTVMQHQFKEKTGNEYSNVPGKNIYSLHLAVGRF